MQLKRCIRNFFKPTFRSYMTALGSVFLFSVFSNCVTCDTLWRKHHVQGVAVMSETDILPVIKSAEGDGLEEKIREVISEDLDFRKEEVSDGFKEKLFSYLEGKVGAVKGQHLTLEEKIMYAQMFSSTLEYNDKANWIEKIAYSDEVDVPGALKGIYEYGKITGMGSEEIIEYRTVVCGQYAKVFASALNVINESSADPEDIHVATLTFVPNFDRHYGKYLDVLVSVLNAVVFSEYRSSVGHVINLVATEDKFYLIEPQQKVSGSHFDSPLAFSDEYLDISVDYAAKLRNVRRTVP